MPQFTSVTRPRLRLCVLSATKIRKHGQRSARLLIKQARDIYVNRIWLCFGKREGAIILWSIKRGSA
jgi:hypothetical protein